MGHPFKRNENTKAKKKKIANIKMGHNEKTVKEHN